MNAQQDLPPDHFQNATWASRWLSSRLKAEIDKRAARDELPKAAVQALKASANGCERSWKVFFTPGSTWTVEGSTHSKFKNLSAQGGKKPIRHALTWTVRIHTKDAKDVQSAGEPQEFTVALQGFADDPFEEKDTLPEWGTVSKPRSKRAPKKGDVSIGEDEDAEDGSSDDRARQASVERQEAEWAPLRKSLSHHIYSLGNWLQKRLNLSNDVMEQMEDDVFNEGCEGLDNWIFTGEFPLPERIEWPERALPEGESPESYNQWEEVSEPGSGCSLYKSISYGVAMEGEVKVKEFTLMWEVKQSDSDIYLTQAAIRPSDWFEPSASYSWTAVNKQSQ
jgi:hypothetical protein